MKEMAVSEIIAAVLLIALVTASMGIVAVVLTSNIIPTEVPHMGFLACNNSTKVFLYHTGGDAIIPDQLHSDIEIRFLDRDKKAIHSEWIQEPWFTSRVLNYSYPSGAQYTQLIVPSGSGDSLIEWTEIKPCVGTYIPRPGPGPGPGPSGCPSVSISGTITESGTGNPEPGITVNAYYEEGSKTAISGSDGSYSINLPLTGNLEQYDIHCPDTGTWQTTIPASKWHYGIVIDQSSGTACNPAGYDFEGTYTGTPGLTVTSPNGGEKFAVGSIQTISWTVEHISPDHFSIEYSIDNGNNWNSIGSSVSGILRNFEWTVPNTPTDQALVRVTAGDSLGNTLAGDTSDSVFTIFNPDCYRISGQVLNQTTGNPVGGIRINAYYQGEHTTIIGNADTTGDGRYTILLPATGNLEQYDIHCPDTGTWQTTIPASKWHYGIVIDPSSSTQCHPDGVDFQGRIIVSPVLEVTSPNGGEDWVVGTEHQITWSVENVDAASYRIEYSIDSGVNWILIDDAVSGSSVSYSWTLPETPSELALIRVIAKDSSGTTIIEDDSDNVFSISAPCIKTISATAGDHGSISPSGTVEAPCGLDQLFTITADACYGIESVTIDGVPISGTFDSPYTYTFPSVQSDHTIHATFTPITYTITAIAGDHGSISPSGTVEAPCGLDQSFTITADACYGIESVTIDGVPFSGIFDSPYTYTFPSVQSVHTIHATFTPTSYTITTSTGNNGSISPSGTLEVLCGSDQSFTITPNPSYRIDTVVIDGVPISDTFNSPYAYTFPSVQSDHTIHATFTPTTYTITASAGNNGSISPSGLVEVPSGSDQSFTITPNPCYRIESVLVDSVPLSGPFVSPYSYTFSSVQSDHIIQATFTLTTYSITASAGNNGSISPSGSVEVPCGSDQSFTITADPCYKISLIIVDGNPLTGPFTSPYSYIFTDIQGDHTISATFTRNSFIISSSAGTGGSISPSGSVSVLCGDSQTFTITPNFFRRIDYILIDGVQIGAVTTYTFSNVQTDHSIYAAFRWLW